MDISSHRVNFTSHIYSMIVKASRMLGYIRIRRISKEFRDPYTFKTLYNSFVWYHLDYTSVVWNPYYSMQENRGYPEKVFGIRVVYAGIEPRYRTTFPHSKN
jgi:hypothetical protein